MSTRLGRAEGMSTAQSGLDKTERFRSVLLPTRPGQGGQQHHAALHSFRNRGLQKQVAALEQPEFPCLSAQRFRLHFFHRRPAGLFVEHAGAAHLQLAVRALFTHIHNRCDCSPVWSLGRLPLQAELWLWHPPTAMVNSIITDSDMPQGLWLC